MSTRLFSESWSAHQADVTRVIGCTEFATKLVAALGSIRSIQATTLYLYPHAGSPQVLFEQDDEGSWVSNGNVRSYLSGCYSLEPFPGGCLEQIESGCYGLSELTSKAFRLGEYYQSCYRHAFIEDELNYILQVASGKSIAMSLAFTSTLDRQSLMLFRLISPWVLSVLQRHYEISQSSASRGQSITRRRIHTALHSFGRPILTERECRIAQMILRGHSTRSLAQCLGVTEDTIKSHRKKIYAKLDIGTQSQLFSLFIDDLSKTPDMLKSARCKASRPS